MDHVIRISVNINTRNRTNSMSLTFVLTKTQINPRGNVMWFYNKIPDGIHTLFTTIYEDFLWLLGKQSSVSLSNKLTLSCSIIKPICTHKIVVVTASKTKFTCLQTNIICCILVFATQKTMTI